jgi:arsenate reductase
MAIDVLTEMQVPTRGLRSKSWGEFAGLDAPGMDFIFTVCDAAAGEACPIWPGKPMTAHWGIPDPAKVEGTEEQQHRAFLVAATQLRNRIQLFASLPIEQLDRLALHEHLIDIGKSTT